MLPRTCKSRRTLAAKLRRVRGAVDVHVQQITNAPDFFVNVDRQRAAELGLTEQQVAQRR